MQGEHGRTAEPAFPADLAESPVPFRFSLAWSPLFTLLEPVKTPAVLAPVPSRMRAAVAAPQPPPVMEPPKPALGSKVNWEMVVPKMNRPLPRPEPATPPPPQPPVTAPNFYISSEPVLAEPSGSRFFSLKLIAGAAMIVALSIGLWMFAGSHSRPHMVEITSAMGEGGWAREHVAANAGLKQGRELVVYRPSVGAGDSRIEFTWRVDDKGIGWVFRAQDTANYYAARLKILRPGPAPTLAVEHFTVFQGVESAHEEKAVSFSRNEPDLRVRMDAFGPSFTLYLQGIAADYWTDGRFKTGGLGFFEERNRPAEARGLRISFSSSASGGA